MATQLKNLNVGDKVRLGKYQVKSEAKKDLVWTIAGKNHIGYPGNSVTLLTDRIIDLRAFDAKEPSNANSDRKNYGNNRYLDSNLRQWLNKAGQPWFVKTHGADEAPTNANLHSSGQTEYHNRDGFLSSFNAEELNGILDTTLTVAKNTVTDGGGTETVIDKVFLLSNTEVGLANEPGGAEGSKLALFSTDASRIAYPTQELISNTSASSKPANTSTAWYYWLRSPHSGYSGDVRLVSSDGSLSNDIASLGNSGVRPALNFSGDVGVELAGDGVYDLVFNTAPVISGSDTNLGNVTDEVTYTYTVTDVDGDKLSIVERLNNEIIKTRSNVDSGSSYTITITRQELYDLPLGVQNTLEIEVYDGTVRAYRIIRFTRSNTAPEVTIIGASDLGNITLAPTIEILVEDPEGDEVDVKVSLNGVLIETLEDVELDSSFFYPVPHDNWVVLGPGPHQLRFTATDAEGGESYKNVSFIKSEDKIEVITSVLTTDLMVEEIIPISWLRFTSSNGGPSYTMTVYATNNGHDDSPVWEEVTDETLSGNIYTFANNSKTASDWGIAIKIVIETE